MPVLDGVFKDLSKNFAKINLIWSDPWRGKQDVENIMWLDALQTCQSKGRFGSTERIQRRKTTERAAPWVIIIEVMAWKLIELWFCLLFLVLRPQMCLGAKWRS